MLHIAVLFLLSLGISYYFFSQNRGRFTVNEFVMMQVITVVVAVGGYFAARHASLQSIEHLNGRIVGKPSGTQHCCHCRQECDTCSSSSTDSQGRTSTRTYSCNCREVCDHFVDYWWKLDVSTGVPGADQVTVRDCASSSIYVPEAWTHAQIGEAASVAHRYTNYLRADPGSLLRHQGSPYVSLVPEFPEIYDFYKVNKVIGVDIPVPQAWHEALRELNATVGREKQVDITLLMTNSADPRYAEGVEEKWLYGPKNALIIVMGIANDRIAWARVVTISKVETLKIKLRDQLPGKTLGDPEVISTIGNLVMHEFERTPMAEFEYLLSAATPSTGWLVFLYLVHILGSIGLALYFVENRHTEWHQIAPRSSRQFRVGRRIVTVDQSASEDPDLRPGALLGRRWFRK